MIIIRFYTPAPIPSNYATFAEYYEAFSEWERKNYPPGHRKTTYKYYAQHKKTNAKKYGKAADAVLNIKDETKVKAETKVKPATKAKPKAASAPDAKLKGSASKLSLEKSPPGGWKPEDKVNAPRSKKPPFQIQTQTIQQESSPEITQEMEAHRSARLDGFRKEYGHDALNPLKTSQNEYAKASWQFNLINHMHRPDILDNMDRDKEIQHYRILHATAVHAAHLAGKPVSPKAIADYPNLKPEDAAKVAKVPAKAKATVKSIPKVSAKAKATVKAVPKAKVPPEVKSPSLRKIAAPTDKSNSGDLLKYIESKLPELSSSPALENLKMYSDKRIKIEDDILNDIVGNYKKTLKKTSLDSLWKSVSEKNKDMSIGEFHDTLRNFHSEGKIELAEWNKDLDYLPDPKVAFFGTDRQPPTDRSDVWRSAELFYSAAPAGSTLKSSWKSKNTKRPLRKFSPKSQKAPVSIDTADDLLQYAESKLPEISSLPSLGVLKSESARNDVELGEEIVREVNKFFKRTLAGQPIDRLWETISKTNKGLSVGKFQDVLRRLNGDGSIRLSGWARHLNQLPRPELALFISTRVLYYAQPAYKN